MFEFEMPVLPENVSASDYKEAYLSRYKKSYYYLSQFKKQILLFSNNFLKGLLIYKGEVSPYYKFFVCPKGFSDIFTKILLLSESAAEPEILIRNTYEQLIIEYKAPVKITEEEKEELEFIASKSGFEILFSKDGITVTAELLLSQKLHFYAVHPSEFYLELIRAQFWVRFFNTPSDNFGGSKNPSDKHKPQ